MATRLKPLDASWLYVDSRATRCTSSLQIFHAAAKAGRISCANWWRG